MTNTLRILSKSVVAFFAELGILLVGYYAYVTWSGLSVTGNLFSDLLVPASLSMLLILNIAAVSKWSSREKESTQVDLDEAARGGGTKKEQALKYLKILGNLSSNQLAALLEVDVRNLSKFINPYLQTGIIAARKAGKTYIYSIKNQHSLLNTNNRHNTQEDTEYADQIKLPRANIHLPSEGNVLGRVALDDWALGDFVYLPLKKYAQKGVLVSGASGSGKTIAAKVMVEELLQENIPVVVFDYTNQWERLFEKNDEPEMLERYRLFGMKKSPKACRGSVVEELPAISEVLQNGCVILDLSSVLEADERVGMVAKVLDEILEYFQTQDDSQDLRVLLVIEEAHLWTSKDVPKEAASFLDRIVRLLRKKGVGVMLISHKISDFDPAMRSSMNISIVFRTKYDGDLDTIGRMMGRDFSKLTPSMPVGYSLFHSSDVGSPFVMAWRPLYSEP